IPDEVLAPLAPSQARQRVFCAWLRRADLFEPDEVKFSRLEMIGFHSVLFDDPVDLVASAVGVRREEVRWAGLPGLIRPGISRSWDLLRRYQIWPCGFSLGRPWGAGRSPASSLSSRSSAYEQSSRTCTLPRG